jgi:four helix bundle protein
MQDHRKLRVYPASLDLCAAVDGIISVLTAQRKFSLAWQLERASFSVAINVAEGAGRHTSADFARFLDMAIGSANEVECCLDLGLRLRLLGSAETAGVYAHIQKVRRMLCALANRIRGGRIRGVRQATGNR